MSANFPVTNGGLANAFFALHNAVISTAHERSEYAGPATPMDVACILSAAFAAVGEQLMHGNNGHPQTHVPLPENAHMAAAMEMVGLDYLQRNAPERLRQDVLTVPRELFVNMVNLLAAMNQNNPNTVYRKEAVRCVEEAGKIIVDSVSKPG